MVTIVEPLLMKYIKNDKTKSFINGDFSCGLWDIIFIYIQCDVMEIDLRDI